MDRTPPWDCQYLEGKLKSAEQRPKRNYQKGKKNPLEQNVQKIKGRMKFKKGRIAQNMQLRGQLRTEDVN